MSEIDCERLYVRADITFSYEIDMTDPEVVRGGKTFEEVRAQMKADLESWIAEEMPEDDDFFQNTKVLVFVYIDEEPYV